MMLQVRNCKLILLAALLIGAAGSLAAEEYSKGLFSVSATERVKFATTNCTNGTDNFFAWGEIASHMETHCRVLTKAEWQYLFASEGGRPHAYELYALSRIEKSTTPGEYTNGLVILPDYEFWTLPAELTFDYTHTGGGYEKNTYTATQWAQMEAAGAVFLPADGYWDGSKAEDVNVHGSYWTATEENDQAYRLQLDDVFFNDNQTRPKTNKYSLRAVLDEDYVVLSENDEQSEFAAKKALLQTPASTEAYIIRTLRKAGCFNTLTLPFNVPDIASSPLVGDNVEVYTFTSATVEDGTLQLDIAPVTSNSLDAGTPYLIQWDNTGEEIKVMHFTGITSSSWDSDEKADSVGTGAVQFKGFYGKTHINDDRDGDQHLNLFLGANNELYWPTDGDDPEAKMLGFRAFFNVTTGVSSSPIRRGMPAALRIVENSNTTTDVDHVQRDDAQCTKVMRDGQLYLLHNGRMYNVQGQMIKEGGLQ